MKESTPTTRPARREQPQNPWTIPLTGSEPVISNVARGQHFEMTPKYIPYYQIGLSELERLIAGLSV